MWKYDNKYIQFVQCCYSGFFCDILSLNVKMYLWLKWYTVPFFVSGQTYKISKGSNNYSSHCTSWSSSVLCTAMAKERANENNDMSRKTEFTSHLSHLSKWISLCSSTFFCIISNIVLLQGQIFFINIHKSILYRYWIVTLYYSKLLTIHLQCTNPCPCKVRYNYLMKVKGSKNYILLITHIYQNWI